MTALYIFYCIFISCTWIFYVYGWSHWSACNPWPFLFTILLKQPDWPIKAGHSSGWWVKCERFTGLIDPANGKRLAYRMILARCILSLAGYGPWERKPFLTARPAQGKLCEHDWNEQKQASINIPKSETYKSGLVCKNYLKNILFMYWFLVNIKQRWPYVVTCCWQWPDHEDSSLPPEKGNIDPATKVVLPL